MSTKSLGTLTVDMALQTAGFEQGMDKAARTADRKTRQIEREAAARAKAIEDAFMKMAAGVTAAWGALNLVQSVKGAADLSDQLSKLSQRTGVAVKQLSALNYAAGLNDATLQDLGNGLKGLSNKMLAAQGGSAEAGAAFAALGVKVTDSTGKLRPAEQVMLDIADAFSKMEDGAGKSALANKLMEESGIRLIPTLNNGRAGLKAMADESERFNTQMATLAPVAVEFNDNLARVQVQGQGAAATIGNATIPALNALMVEMIELSRQTQFWDGVAQAAKTTIEALSVTGVNVAYVFNGVGNEIGGIAAQLAALARGDLDAFRTIGQLMKEDATEARKQLDALEQRILNPVRLPVQAAPALAPAPTVPTGSPKGPKAPKQAYTDPLAEQAKVYAQTLQWLSEAQRDADTTGLNLTATQERLMEAMADPTFAAMPETWRTLIATQGEAALEAERLAAQQVRLNELLATTPTAQLERQREVMQFLADAFEAGTISAVQFSEAAAAALGNVPKAVEDTSDKLLDMSLVANDAANLMASAFGAFFTGQEQDVKAMLASFLKAMAQMIAQATILKALKSSSTFGGLFANGAAFDGGVKKFAAGGTFTNAVVNQPTLFKFASGGRFQTGVMGEAGPEAVMPLKRGKDGKLGVQATGTGTTIVQNFNVTVEGGTGTDGRKQGEAITKELRQSVRAAVLEVITDQKRYGGALA